MKRLLRLKVGALLGTRRSAIGQLFSMSQKSLGKLTRPSFPLVSEVANAVFLHDVTAAMLMFKTSLVRLFSYVNACFCSNKLA